MQYVVVVVDQIRGSRLEGSSLLTIFEGERKGSSPWSGARAFKKCGHRALYTTFWKNTFQKNFIRTLKLAFFA
jgi:hypothetical protein